MAIRICDRCGKRSHTVRPSQVFKGSYCALCFFVILENTDEVNEARDTLVNGESFCGF